MCAGIRATSISPAFKAAQMEWVQQRPIDKGVGFNDITNFERFLFLEKKLVVIVVEERNFSAKKLHFVFLKRSVERYTDNVTIFEFKWRALVSVVL